MNKDVFIENFFKVLMAFFILISFLYILTPFVIPILLGGIFAMAFSPLVGYFTKKGYNRKLAIVVLTFSLFIVGAIPITVVFIRGTKIVSTFLSEQSWIVIKQNFEDRIYAFLDNFSNLNKFDPTTIRAKFDGFVSASGSYAFNLVSNFLTHIPEIILLGVITVLSSYFFLANEASIRKLFDRYFYFSKTNGDRFISLVKSSCNQVFFSNVIMGLVQATIIAGGAFFCRIGDSFIIFVCVFFLSFIPVFGSGPFSFCIAILAFLEHRTGAGIAMAIIASISGLTDNFLRPYLTTLGEVKVHGFITFLAIIGGVLVMGLSGLFFGPLLALLTFGALPIILDEFFPDRNHE